jgi:outer membrane protein assembly factor BamB
MYVGASDGALYAIDTATGAQKWRRAVADPAAGDRGPTVLGGIGGALLATTRSKTDKPALFDAQTGAPLQTWPSRYGVFFAPALGIVTQHMNDHGGPYPWMDIAVQDRCGQTRWSLPATRPQWPVLVGPGDQLYVVERDDETSSPTFVSVYAPDGSRVLGPVAAAPPWAIGKDGTVYAVQCDAPGHDGPSRMIAYDAALQEKWRLELGASCPSAGPVIGEDGKLYFTWYIGQVTELVAVQTESPGLSDSAWPARRRDEKGTAWVK